MYASTLARAQHGPRKSPPDADYAARKTLFRCSANNTKAVRFLLHESNQVESSRLARRADRRPAPLLAYSREDGALPRGRDPLRRHGAPGRSARGGRERGVGRIVVVGVRVDVVGERAEESVRVLPLFVGVLRFGTELGVVSCG